MAFGRSRILGAALVALAFTVASPDARADGHGEELFELCAQCHGERGEGNPEVLAPPIAGLSEWYVVRQLEKWKAGIRGYHPDDVGGLRMYPMSLSLKGEGDVEAVSAYVASLPAVKPEPTLDGDPERGKQLYTLCAACHMADASGNEAQGGPNLKVSADWYLAKQLRHYKAKIRGAHPDDQQGVLMYPMAMTLTDEQAIQDVVAYIVSLD